MAEVDKDREVLCVHDADLKLVPAPGVLRRLAFEDGLTPGEDVQVLVQHTRNDPGQWSNWHVHPNYVTYGYELTGVLRVEYGPGGKKFVEAGAGDFVRVPSGIIHREGSIGHEVRTGVGVRIGSGPYVVDVEGPDPENVHERGSAT
jgi:uncharacterized RmlC-like cupin family protein